MSDNEKDEMVVKKNGNIETDTTARIGNLFASFRNHGLGIAINSNSQSSQRFFDEKTPPLSNASRNQIQNSQLGHLQLSSCEEDRHILPYPLRQSLSIPHDQEISRIYPSNKSDSSMPNTSPLGNSHNKILRFNNHNTSSQQLIRDLHDRSNDRIQRTELDKSFQSFVPSSKAYQPSCDVTQTRNCNFKKYQRDPNQPLNDPSVQFYQQPVGRSTNSSKLPNYHRSQRIKEHPDRIYNSIEEKIIFDQTVTVDRRAQPIQSPSFTKNVRSSEVQNNTVNQSLNETSLHFYQKPFSPSIANDSSNSSKVTNQSSIHIRNKKQQLQDSSIEKTTSNHNSSLELKASPIPSLSSIIEPSNDFINVTNVSAAEAKRRKRMSLYCSVEGCQKKIRSRGVCIRHGGGMTCLVDQCENLAVGKSVCIKHGGGKRCDVADCDRAARRDGKCWRHGGKQTCKYKGCDKGPKEAGFCKKHKKRRT